MNVTIGGRYLPPNPLFNHPMWGAVLRALAPPPAAPVLPRQAADIGGEMWGGPGLHLATPTPGQGSYDVGGQMVTPGMAQYVPGPSAAAHYYNPGGPMVRLPSPPPGWNRDPGFNGDGRVPPALIEALRALAGHSNFHPM